MKVISSNPVAGPRRDAVVETRVVGGLVELKVGGHVVIRPVVDTRPMANLLRQADIARDVKRFTGEGPTNFGGFL